MGIFTPTTVKIETQVKPIFQLKRSSMVYSLSEHVVSNFLILVFLSIFVLIVILYRIVLPNLFLPFRTRRTCPCGILHTRLNK